MDILLNNEMFVTITGLLLFFLISIILNFIDNTYKKVTKKPTRPNTTLNCGIWAWAGKDSKDFNKSKFDILGLYNDARGGQGCGIYKNGEILKSSKEKEYKDFLVNINYDNDLENPVIFGHARKSSSGTVSDNNTHPFGFGELENKEYEFAGVHNGTLYNERELSELYESDYSKIDSHILLESIYKSQNFKVLNNYIGAAAIVFVNNNEPNTLYAFRGASKKFEYSKDVEDERPLYFYQESKNSLYISSIEKSLIAITEKQDDIVNIEEFQANKVYKIVDGNIENSTKTNISRGDSFQRNSSYGANNAWSSYNSNKGSSNSRVGNRKKTTKIDLNEQIKNKSKANKKFDITKESLKRPKNNGGTIQFEKFTYCRNGHPVTGIFVYDLFEGLTFLDKDYVDAAQEFYAKYVNMYYDIKNGEYVKDLNLIDHDNYFMPYPLSSINGKKELPLIYIVKGHRLMLRQDYEATYNNKNMDVYNLQFCTFYPVLNNKEASYKGKKVMHDRINPLGSDFIYTIVDGKVVSRKKKNTVGLLKTINSSFDIKEADINYKDNMSALFNDEPYDVKFKKGDYKKNYDGLFGQYLEDLETDEGPPLDTIFNLPKEDVEIYEDIEVHQVEEIDDMDYITKEEKRIINHVSRKTVVFSDKYILKKIDVLKNIKNNKAQKLIEIMETFVNSVKEFEENETDRIVKNL